MCDGFIQVFDLCDVSVAAATSHAVVRNFFSFFFFVAIFLFSRARHVFVFAVVELYSMYHQWWLFILLLLLYDWLFFAALSPGTLFLIKKQ